MREQALPRYGLALAMVFTIGTLSAGVASAHSASNPCVITGLTKDTIALNKLLGAGSGASLDGEHPNACDVLSGATGRYGEVYVSPKSQAASLEQEELGVNFNNRPVTKQKLSGLGGAAARYYYKTPGDAIVNFTVGSFFIQIFGTPTMLIPLAHLVYSKLV
jgi:hypothetical protein